MSGQALFDAANAAADAMRWGEALAIYKTLESRLANSKGAGSARVLGIVRVRMAIALLGLKRNTEAERPLRLGMAAIPLDDPILRADRYSGALALAAIDYANNDYAVSRQSARIAAADAETPLEKLEAAMWLVRGSMFDESDEARAAAAGAVAAAQANPEISKKRLADLRTMHARVLLSHGEEAAAYSELKRALAAQGGLTNRVSLGDIITRSDLGIAALLNKDSENARRYLAYTGAGRMEKSPFATAAVMAPPECGGPANLLPTDVAIVEFGIDDDGAVAYAHPVYASRLGPAAGEFARAVREWSWRSDIAKTIPSFFRAVTRVELRCATSSQRPDVQSFLDEKSEALLDRFGKVPVERTGVAATDLRLLKASLAAIDVSSDKTNLIPVLFALADNPAGTIEERQVWLKRVEGLLETAKAPIALRTHVAIALANKKLQGKTFEPRLFRATLRGVLLRPEVAADAISSGVLRLLIADPQYQTPAPADALALTEAVANDARLSATDPLRVAALVRLAALQAVAGQVDAARTTYNRTGLTAQQCALVDAQPVVTRSNVSSADFPQEAQRWGFSGWVRVEYDIGADGRTIGQRAIVAYPPFVFREAAVSMARDLRYTQSYRPEGGPGCTGKQKNIQFLSAPVTTDPG